MCLFASHHWKNKSPTQVWPNPSWQRYLQVLILCQNHTSLEQATSGSSRINICRCLPDQGSSGGAGSQTHYHPSLPLNRWRGFYLHLINCTRTSALHEVLSPMTSFHVLFGVRQLKIEDLIPLSHGKMEVYRNCLFWTLSDMKIQRTFTGILFKNHAILEVHRTSY